MAFMGVGGLWFAVGAVGAAEHMRRISVRHADICLQVSVEANVITRRARDP